MKKFSLKKIFIFLALLFFLYSILYRLSSNQISFNLPKFNNSTLNNKESIVNTKTIIIDEESVVIDVVEKSLPSVVTIGIKTTQRTRGSFGLNPFDPFEPFNFEPEEKKIIERNIGSGFIVSTDGLVITNKHVVSETNAKYTVITNDKKKFDVQRIYRDPLNDLAILKINASNLKSLELGNSDNLKLGQTVVAIGTPLGEFQNTVTSGIISGLGRGITAGSPFEGFVEQLDGVIQTDASISSGNSGGPLLNSKAQVIGINTAVSSSGENIGFAIPVNVVKNLIENFNKRGGSFDRPYIGIRYTMIDKEIGEAENLPEGAFIESVESDSPAFNANLKAGDVITTIDNKPIKGSDNQAIARAIADKNVGDKIKIEFLRNGRLLSIELTLAKFEE